MRAHEVVIVVAILFAGSNVAGAMARREAPLKASEIRPVSTPAPCARAADHPFRCDPARPRALDARRILMEPLARVAKRFRCAPPHSAEPVRRTAASIHSIQEDPSCAW